jgi:uncharacterized membrane protein HdeD (DUF308 family)
MDLNFLTNYLHGDKKQLMTIIIAVEAVVAGCFAICSWVVAGTANNGFNVVLVGLLNIAFVVGSYYVIKSSKVPLAVMFNSHFSSLK